MHSPSRQTSPFELGLLLLLGALWGIPYALTKISLETIPPITLTAGRLSLAAVTLWIVAFSLGRKMPSRRENFVSRLFVQGAVACVIPYTLIAFGQQSVDSGLAAILNSSTPLFVCLIGVVWTHHEPITPRRLWGAVVGVSGVVLIVGTSALSALGRPSVGQMAIVLATFSSAISVIHARRFNSMAPEIVAAGMLTWAAVAVVPAAIYFERPWHVAPSATSVLALAANAIIATGLGFILYFRLVRTLGSMGTASTGYLKPLVGVLAGCALFGERLTPSMGTGLIAIFFGVACINEAASVRWLMANLIRASELSWQWACQRWCYLFG